MVVYVADGKVRQREIDGVTPYAVWHAPIVGVIHASASQHNLVTGVAIAAQSNIAASYIKC